jgi:hypothetical protein
MKVPRRLSSPKRIAIASNDSRAQLQLVETLMASDIPHQAKLSVAASFLPHFFLENLAIRRDNSILVTVATRKELWYIPPPRAGAQVDPMLLHTFDELPSGIVEHEPDVFYICTGNAYTTHEAYLHRLDLRGWAPGATVKPELVLTFPEEARGLNGSCLIEPDTILIADTFAGLIWRVDLPPSGKCEPRIWLSHESMAHIADTLPPPPQPGINGIRYASKTNFLYYTSTGCVSIRRPTIPRERPNSSTAARWPTISA